MLRPFLLLAAFFGFTGVALGAFAAHGLKKQLSAEYLAVFQTGVHYQLIHALALFGVALLATRLDGRLVSAAGGLFTLGILLFSLSTLFQLVTLPTEFNASARALKTLESYGILDGDELVGARSTLRAPTSSSPSRIP